jgi:thioredoxin reductase (NADPH)
MKEAERTIPTDYFIPFGLTPKLGPLETGVRELRKMLLKSIIPWITRLNHIFAIGDVNVQYQVKLILCGFHEATLMCQAAYQIINPGKKYVKIH